MVGLSHWLGVGHKRTTVRGRQAPWQWPLSVSLHPSIYVLHMHAGHHGAVTMACDFRRRGLQYRSCLPWCGTVSLGKTLHLYVNSVDPGVNGYLIGQWLLMCLNSYQNLKKWQQGCMLPMVQGIELQLEWTGPTYITRAIDHDPWEDHIMYLTGYHG